MAARTRPNYLSRLVTFVELINAETELLNWKTVDHSVSSKCRLKGLDELGLTCTRFYPSPIQVTKQVQWHHNIYEWIPIGSLGDLGYSKELMFGLNSYFL